MSILSCNHAQRVGAALAAALLLSGAVATAQGPVDIYRNSLTELGGTARSQAMSGAVGALGADGTAISVNPAGVGLYRGVETGFTFDFSFLRSSTGEAQGIEPISADRRMGGFDHLSVALPIQSRPTSDWRFGFAGSYNKLASFDADYMVKRAAPEFGMPEYMANVATSLGAAPQRIESFTSTPNFLATMGWLGGFIEQKPGYEDVYVPATYAAKDPFAADKYGEANITYLRPEASLLQISERGSRGALDFTFGGSWRDRIYFGLGFRTTTLSRSHRSTYSEDYLYVYRPDFDEPDQVYRTELTNGLTTSGSTVGLSLGVLAALGDFGRIGFSYTTPQAGTYRETFYTATAFVNSNRTNSSGAPEPLYEVSTDDMTNEYQVILPGEMTASAMLFLPAGLGMVTYDFSYRNLGQAKYQGSAFTDINSFIREDYGGQMTHRVGLEIRPISGLYLRAGYSRSDSGIRAAELRPTDGNLLTYDYIASGALTDAAFRDSYRTITAGLGARLFGNTTLDLAYVNGLATERVFPFPAAPEVRDREGGLLAPAVNSQGTQLKHLTHRIVATLSFHF